MHFPDVFRRSNTAISSISWEAITLACSRDISVPFFGLDLQEKLVGEDIGKKAVF